MTLLSWVQPADLLAHELAASSADGKDLEDITRRWSAAGGSTMAPVSGATVPPAATELQELARDLLAELDGRPADPDIEAAVPTDLAAIEDLAGASWPKPEPWRTPDSADLLDRTHGAWLGRAVGCLLGKPVEKIPRHGIRAILTAQGRWPLHDYFTAADLPADVAAEFPWNRRSAATSLLENIDGMPEDDDLNFPLIAVRLLERCGAGFTTDDVADAWLAELPGGRVFTAERVAYRNLLLGLTPPRTATFENPFREWIGAQIRADVYGWTNPGDPATAARQAWRDARLSHVRAGVHGAMFVAAACAAVVDGGGLEDALNAGTSVVPPESPHAQAIHRGRKLAESGVDDEAGIDAIYKSYGGLHWVHVLNNSALVAFALARSGGEFDRAICLAVSGGWDTDSNGATVGSICGALAGASRLPSRWTDPLRNRLSTSLPGWHDVGFDELARRTVALARR